MFMIKSEPSQAEVQCACILMGTVPNHIATNAYNSLSLPEGGSCGVLVNVLITGCLGRG